MKKTSVKKVPAKRGSQRRQAGVLLERTDKVVTKDKGTVLKIFGPSYKVSAILNEAMNEARAAETGLPVAKVLEVLKIRDHWCIRREWVEGDTLADVMAKDKKNLVRYLKQFVAIQCQIFAKTSERMGNLADKLDKQISASPLPKETRYDLHMKLQSFPRGKALCHGDACEALKVKLPDVQKWLPIVAAAESSRDQTPKNHELLVHWASVVDIE